MITFDTFLEDVQLRDSLISSADKAYFGMQMEDFDPEVEDEIRRYKEGANSTKQDRDHTRYKGLADLINGTKLNREYIVYRAFGGKYDRTALKVGEVLKDNRSFMSTSLRWSVARQFINPKAFNDKTNWIARIRLPKGTKAFYVDVVENKHEDEREILVNKGVPLTVSGFTEQNGIHIVEMTA